jgi:hypothetical protein
VHRPRTLRPTRRTLRASLVLFAALGLVVVEPACGGSSPPTETSGGGARSLARWEDETLGPLRLGMREAEIVAAIGEPPSRPPFQEMEATGERIAQWEWPSLGVSARMIDGDGGAEVAAIELSAPCTFLSGQGGIGIGAAYDDVLAAYADVPSGEDPSPRTDASRERITIGNAYANLSFRFADGRVRDVHLGSTGAE